MGQWCQQISDLGLDCSYRQGPGLLEKSEKEPKAGWNAQLDQGLGADAVSIAWPDTSGFDRPGPEVPLSDGADLDRVTWARKMEGLATKNGIRDKTRL